MKILMVGKPNMEYKNLLQILTQKMKYTTPEVEIIEFNTKDVLTSSGEMAEIEFNNKTKKTVNNKKDEEKEPPMLTDNTRVIPGTGNVVNVYPDGLPRNVLEAIDYKKFGAMLKQEQLLPPSYDKKPVKVEIGDWCGFPRVFLTFKSKTSESFRIVGICRYSVAYSTRMDKPIKVMETNPLMIPVWHRFAESVMWAWERGYRYQLLDQQRICEPTRTIYDESTYRRIQITEHIKDIFNEDKNNIINYSNKLKNKEKEREKIKKMAEEYEKVIEEQHKDL